MSECENVDENAPQARQRIKRSIGRISKKQSCEWNRTWRRYKLIDVLTNKVLLARVIFGKEGIYWRWAER